jgi:hypothetical protein
MTELDKAYINFAKAAVQLDIAETQYRQAQAQHAQAKQSLIFELQKPAPPPEKPDANDTD